MRTTRNGRGGWSDRSCAVASPRRVHRRQKAGIVEANRLIAGPSRQAIKPTAPTLMTMFGTHGATSGRQPAAHRDRPGAVEQDVVDEDDGEAEHEARQPAVPAIAGAERQADQREDRAGERQRELVAES